MAHLVAGNLELVVGEVSVPPYLDPAIVCFCIPQHQQEYPEKAGQKWMPFSEHKANPAREVHLLNRQADSLPLSHLRSPNKIICEKPVKTRASNKVLTPEGSGVVRGMYISQLLVCNKNAPKLEQLKTTLNTYSHDFIVRNSRAA